MQFFTACTRFSLYRNGATALSTIRTQFSKFKIVNFDLEKRERYGSR